MEEYMDINVKLKLAPENGQVEFMMKPEEAGYIL